MFQYDESSSPDVLDDAAPEEEAHPQSLSLLTGIGGASNAGPTFGVPAENEKKKLATQSALIIGIISVVAFGALLGMRTFTSPVVAHGATAETDAFIETVDIRLANIGQMDAADPLHPAAMRALFADTDTIIAQIRADPTAKQVPIDQVAKNPFAMHVEEEIIVAEQVDQAALDAAARAATLKDLYTEFDGIELQSVVAGRRPVAVIEGELYQVGDTLGSFTIAAINQRGVAFTTEAVTLRPGERKFVRYVTTD